MNYVIIFLGGGIGSVLRFGISQLLPYNGQGFPMATLISNSLACLIMGVSLLLFKDKIGISEWQLFLLTGVCGGFSTFSTFSLETVQLIQMQNYLFAGLNILISVLTCVFILYLLLKLK